jgi:hypothetical protein
MVDWVSIRSSMERKFEDAADFIESSAEPATPHQGSADGTCQLFDC